MIYNLDNIPGARITSDLNPRLLAKSAKGEKDIFDFDLKSVQLGSVQPRGLLASRALCTTVCPPSTGHSFCCTCKR